jgi:hypothetical protein
MSRPAKNPVMTFDDAVTLHVLRATGSTYAELCRLFGDNSSRVTQVLDGDLYHGSWEAALERLRRGDYWRPEIVDLVERLGAQTLIIATKACDPAKRRYNRLRRTTIPFVAERPVRELPRARRAG